MRNFGEALNDEEVDELLKVRPVRTGRGSPPAPYKLDVDLHPPRTNRTWISPRPVQTGRGSPPAPYKPDADTLPPPFRRGRAWSLGQALIGRGVALI